MKKLLFITLILLTACSSKFNDAVYHDFGTHRHWVVTMTPETTVEDMQEHTKLLAHPEFTTFVYFFKNDINVSETNNAFTQEELYTYFNEIKPVKSFIKTPNSVIEEFNFEDFK